MPSEPLSPSDAKRLMLEILQHGTISFTRHARQEMANDDLTAVEVVHVLRSGVVELSEWEQGTWRYRIRAGRSMVVVAFRSPQALVVITAWRSSR